MYWGQSYDRVRGRPGYVGFAVGNRARWAGLHACNAVEGDMESVRNKGIILGGSRDQDVKLDDTHVTLIPGLAVHKPRGTRVSLLSGSAGLDVFYLEILSGTLHTGPSSGPLLAFGRNSAILTINHGDGGSVGTGACMWVALRIIG